MTVQLNNFAVMFVNRGMRISYTYSKLSDVGEVISDNNKGSFFLADAGIKTKIDDICDYIERTFLAAE